MIYKIADEDRPCMACIRASSRWKEQKKKEIGASASRSGAESVSSLHAPSALGVFFDFIFPKVLQGLAFHEIRTCQ